jgi:hypothetical protein
MRTLRRGEYWDQRRKKQQVCRKMRNEELHNFHSSPNIRVTKFQWATHVACKLQMRSTDEILVGNSERAKTTRET